MPSLGTFFASGLDNPHDPHLIDLLPQGQYPVDLLHPDGCSIFFGGGSQKKPRTCSSLIHVFTENSQKNPRLLARSRKASAQRDHRRFPPFDHGKMAALRW